MHEQTWLDANINWISTVGMVVGIILTIAISWWTRRSVNPGWQLRSQTPLMAAGQNGSALKIVDAAGTDARFPFLNVIRFGNRGRSDLRHRDYDRPVRISFERAKLIGVALHDPLGVDTPVDLTHEGNTVTFTPGLLKKDEWIEVQLMTDGSPELPTLTARVEGHRADMIEISEKRQAFWFSVQFLFGALWFVFGFLNLLLSGDGRVSGLIIFYVALVVFLVATYQKSKSPRWKRELKLPYRRR